jgi:hypothetical protein
MEVASETDLNNAASTAVSSSAGATASGSAGIRTGRIQHLSGAHMNRRMSGVTILSAYEFESHFPITDEHTLAKFDALLDQFPKPPTNLEPNAVGSRGSISSNMSGSSAGSGKQGGGWGLKGLAERFNLFQR